MQLTSAWNGKHFQFMTKPTKMCGQSEDWSTSSSAQSDQSSLCSLLITKTVHDQTGLIGVFDSQPHFEKKIRAKFLKSLCFQARHILVINLLKTNCQ